MDSKTWPAVVHGVAKSWTRLSDWTELNWGLDTRNSTSLVILLEVCGLCSVFVFNLFFLFCRMDYFYLFIIKFTDSFLFHLHSALEFPSTKFISDILFFSSNNSIYFQFPFLCWELLFPSISSVFNLTSWNMVIIASFLVLSGNFSIWLFLRRGQDFCILQVE